MFSKSNQQGSSRFTGFGVLVALVVSSLLAYLWPTASQSYDPFKLASGALLTLVALTMFCLGLVVQQHELVELRERPWSVLLGVLVQCTLMPALAWVVVRTLGLEGHLAYGYIVGRFANMPDAMRRALTLEVGMQNAGLGTALAASLLGSDSLAQIPTAAYTFGCMLTGTLVAAIWARRSVT